MVTWRCVMTHKDAPSITEGRRAFESFWRERKGAGFVGFSRDKHGEYHAEFARDAWAAWIASNKRSAWEPIDTAPKDGRSIILYNSRYDEQAVGFWNGIFSGWHYGNSLFNQGEITHWMPLHAAPKLSDANGEG